MTKPLSEASGTVLSVEIRRLAHALDLPLPCYATILSAGMDLLAAIGGELALEPGARLLVPTGVALALPEGYEAQVRPRSGLALKHGLTLLNAPGTIDADYRGEIKAILINLGSEPVTLRRGDRIAQLIVAPVTRVAWREVETLSASERDDGGFGSTGVARPGVGGR